MVVAMIALGVALSGTAVAAAELAGGDSLIAKNSLSGNRLRNHTISAKQVNLKKLGVVPASEVRTFDVKLQFGQTKTLFKAGTLTFSAKCVKNGTNPAGAPGQDFAEVLVATSKNGGILTSGDGNALNGTSPSDSLETNTPEAKRAIAWETSASGSAFGGIENNGDGYGMDAVDPNGLAVLFPDALTVSVNLFDTDCLVAGVALLP